MKRATWMSVAVALALGARVLAGDAAAVPATAGEAPRTTAAELKKLLENKQAVVVDVRGREAWDKGHIEGALHIPLAELASRMKDLPKDKHVVAYCT